MRITLGFIAAAFMACASSSAERTASNIPPAGTNGSQNVYSPPSGPAGAQMTEQRSTSDNLTGMNTVTGAVASLNRDSITLSAPSGDVKLKVDATTQVLANGMPVAEGLDALREGQHVSASYDPAARHAARIELLNSQGMPEGVNGSAPHQQPKSPGSTDANTQPH